MGFNGKSTWLFLALHVGCKTRYISVLDILVLIDERMYLAIGRVSIFGFYEDHACSLDLLAHLFCSQGHMLIMQVYIMLVFLVG